MTNLTIVAQKIKSQTLAIAIAVAASLAASIPVQAADFDFSGTFENDNDVQLFNFQIDADRTVTVFSSSWLYGDPLPGDPLGGFDPILALWDSAGNLIAQQDDGRNIGSTLSNGVSYNHGYWDTYFTQFLAAGNYTVSIAQFNNFAAGTNLSQGFLRDSQPNFTFTQGYGGATQPLFNGVWDSNDPRTNEWQFHILNADRAEVVNIPEPASAMGLLGFGAVGIAAMLKRKPQRKVLDTAD
jgi:PEP-CTERM motif